MRSSQWPNGATARDGKKFTLRQFDHHTPHRFVLSSVESSGAEPVIHYSGLSTEAVASGLKPFTQYTVRLEVRGANSQQYFYFPLGFIASLLNCGATA